MSIPNCQQRLTGVRVVIFLLRFFVPGELSASPNTSVHSTLADRQIVAIAARTR